MMRMLGLLACLSIAQPAPAEQVNLHPWGVEFLSDDGSEGEWFVLDPFELEIALEENPPVTIDECLAAAQVACTHGIKRFRFSAGPPTICDFECFPGTGTGGP